MDARKRGAWLFDAGDDASGHFYEPVAYHVRRKRHCVRRPGYGPDAQPAGACVQRDAGQAAGLIPGKPCVLRAVAHPHGGGAGHLWRGKRGLCGLHGAGRAVHTVFAHPAGRADRLAGGLCRRAAAPQGAGGKPFVCGAVWRADCRRHAGEQAGGADAAKCRGPAACAEHLAFPHGAFAKRAGRQRAGAAGLPCRVPVAVFGGGMGAWPAL